MSAGTIISYGLAFITIMMFVVTVRAKFEQITMSRNKGGGNGDQTTSAPVSA